MKTQPKSEMRLTDVLQSIDEELIRLRTARNLLTDSPQETQTVRRGPGRPRKHAAADGTQSASQTK